MTPDVTNLASSTEVALALSLAFNAVACGAIWRLWKSREALQDKMTALLVDLAKEMGRLVERLVK